MISPADVRRGMVFRAEHDDSFAGWMGDEPRAKFGVVFNAASLTSPAEDVHYFLTTKNVERFTENLTLIDECVILQKGSYSFLPHETAIDLTELWVVSFVKLLRKRMSHVGDLTPEDLRRCEAVVRSARLLPTKSRKLLGL